ncbi:Bug family tripartite tricarboxylate transporter substrate binding protein [uncultured Enterovirga sp.]|uniref:Bug family tripartite tricarboxylate transporter substrate binding protein n=1 Tax=uncultured Enterovirga sp. TaxID=2026352 RepID=UPI0035C9BCFF
MTRVCLALILAALTFSTALAQSFPSRPVTMVVPFGAGGPTDALARIVAERMRVALGQTVIVENVSGASGTIGMTRVVRAAPDGYTILLGNWPSFVVATATFALPFDVRTDFEPIALLPNNPYIVVSKRDVPAKDLRELIAWLKTNDRVSAGTAGPGAGQHVSGVYFQKSTGTQFQFVPYRAGSSDIMRDLVAGHIDLTFDQAISALPYVRSGQVRAYAITGKSRLAAAPDIPTVDEVGAPGVYISTWFGLWAPKGVPADVVAKLNAAVVEALADPAVRTRLTELGQEIPAASDQTPAALSAHLKSEIDKWWPIIKGANIKAE